MSASQFFFYDVYTNDKRDGITNVSIESAFKNMKCTKGRVGVELYNKYYTSKHMASDTASKIIDDETINNPIYKFYFFETTKNKVMSIEINNDAQIDPSSNNTFLINLCVYHVGFTYKQLLQSELESTITNIYDSYIQNILNPTTDVSGNIIEQPDFLSMELYNYQKRKIKWGNNVELNPFSMSINPKEFIFGDCIVNTTWKTVKKVRDNQSISFNGGCYFDDTGLGKTVEMIAMSLLNRRYPIVDGEMDTTGWNSDNKIKSNATLIVVPSHLAGQWYREFEKMVKSENIYSSENKSGFKIMTFFSDEHYMNVSYKDIVRADIVITTFNFMQRNKYVLNSILKNDEMNKDIYEKEKAFFDSKTLLEGNNMDPKKNFSREFMHTFDFKAGSLNHRYMMERIDMNKKLYSELATKSKRTKNVNLMFVDWNRVIIDEYHEMVTNDNYNVANKVINMLSSRYRWIVTATPFSKGITSLKQMVEYITRGSLNQTNLVPFANPKIQKYIEKEMIRRDTKKSVSDEFNLPPLTEVNHLLSMARTEFMAYRDVATQQKTDKLLLRKLCCHPKFGNTVNGLANNTTLEQIEASIIGAYKTKYLDTFRANYNGVVRTLDKMHRNVVEAFCQDIKNRYQFRDVNKAFVFLDDHFIHPTTKEAIGDYKELGYTDSNFNLSFKKYEDYLKEPKKDCLYHDIYGFMTNIKYRNPYIKVLRIETDEKFIGFDKKMIQNNIDKILEECSETMEINKTRLIYLMSHRDQLNFEIIYNNTYECLHQMDFYKENRSLVDQCLSTKYKYNSYNNITNYIKQLIDGEEVSEDKKYTCVICQDDIDDVNDICMLKCGHIYHYSCFSESHKYQPKCPNDNREVPKKEVQRLEIGDIQKTTEFVNLVGTKVAEIIGILKSSGNNNTIVFSQWDDLLEMVGRTFDECKIKYVYCKGNIYEQDNAITEFMSNPEIRVILLSTDFSASGANLTKAQDIFILDPIEGTTEYRKNIEWQAVGRAYRIGQKNTVCVHRFIMKNTIEEEIYINDKIKNDAIENRKSIFEVQQIDVSELEKDLSAKKSEPSKKVKKAVQKKNQFDDTDED